MSDITKELRDFMAGADGYELWCPRHKAELTEIADRIDAEHEAKVSYWQGASYKDGYDEGFASADDWLGQHEDAMAEHGWVRLPKDVDGEYIQPCDIPYLTKANDGKRLAFCPSLELRQDGTWRLAGWAPDRYRILKPTVEDVLRNVVTLCYNTWKEESPFHFYDVDDVMKSGNIAEYAAKLRLAEGEDA